MVPLAHRKKSENNLFLFYYFPKKINLEPEKANKQTNENWLLGNLEPPSSTDRQASSFERILKSKDVLEIQDADLEKSQGKHITKLLFKGPN